MSTRRTNSLIALIWIGTPLLIASAQALPAILANGAATAQIPQAINNDRRIGL